MTPYVVCHSLLLRSKIVSRSLRYEDGRVYDLRHHTASTIINVLSHIRTRNVYIYMFRRERSFETRNVGEYKRKKKYKMNVWGINAYINMIV